MFYDHILQVLTELSGQTTLVACWHSKCETVTSANSTREEKVNMIREFKAHFFPKSFELTHELLGLTGQYTYWVFHQQIYHLRTFKKRNSKWPTLTEKYCITQSVSTIIREIQSTSSSMLLKYNQSNHTIHISFVMEVWQLGKEDTFVSYCLFERCIQCILYLQRLTSLITSQNSHSIYSSFCSFDNYTSHI